MVLLVVGGRRWMVVEDASRGCDDCDLVGDAARGRLGRRPLGPPPRPSRTRRRARHVRRSRSPTRGGPVADASVRLAPDEGDVIVVKTGADGVAQAEQLAPGELADQRVGDRPRARGGSTRRARRRRDRELALELAAGGRTLSGTSPMRPAARRRRADRCREARRHDARPGDAVATHADRRRRQVPAAVAEGQLLVAASERDYAAQSRYVEVGADRRDRRLPARPRRRDRGHRARRADRRARRRCARVRPARRRRRCSARARATRHRASAGADGRFRIGGLRPGAYELDATRDAARVARADRRRHRRRRAGHRRRGAGRRGRRRSAASSSTRPGRRSPDVAVTRVSRRGRRRRGRTADAKGAFTLTGLARRPLLR